MRKMKSERLNVLLVLYLVLVPAGGQHLENKVARLLRDETEDIRCFVGGTKSLTCFWEEEEDVKNQTRERYSFYSIDTDKKACEVSSLSLPASNRRVLYCRLPRVSFFSPLLVQVFRDGRMLYQRRLNVENIVFLDPPRNLTVTSTGREGQLNISWRPPPIRYMEDSVIYEVRYARDGSHMGKVEKTKVSTMLVLRGLQPVSRYQVWVRIKVDGVAFNGYWSDWTPATVGLTLPSDLDPLIVLLVLVIGSILLLLSLTLILSRKKVLLKKLWPEIPTPEHKFPGLFTVFKGDFKEWMSQNNGSMWGRHVHVYSEEPASSLEVLSESSPAHQPEKEASHWLTEDKPESSSLTHDAYVSLSQHSQQDDVSEESLPLRTLFTSSGSDLGSARLSSQSSLEFPDHAQGYAYMAVADSGVCVDYSPMSSSGIPELGKRPLYAHEYRNDAIGHRWQFPVES